MHLTNYHFNFRTGGHTIVLSRSWCAKRRDENPQKFLACSWPFWSKDRIAIWVAKCVRAFTIHRAQITYSVKVLIFKRATNTIYSLDEKFRCKTIILSITVKKILGRKEKMSSTLRSILHNTCGALALKLLNTQFI